MRFRLLAVGRVDRSVGPACEEYEKRIKRYLRFEVFEVPAARAIKDPAAMRAAEAEAMLKSLTPGERLVLVTRMGSAVTSKELAAHLGKLQEDARDVAFAIGGSEGFDRKIVDRSEQALSLTSMTLPHDLARLVLLEQIYRSCTILRGEPYHRGS